MKHLYVPTLVNTFHKNDKWQFIVFINCNDAVTQQINTCTQQMLICHYKHVYLHGIFAYENINVMTFKCIFGHYDNKRFVERIPQWDYLWSCGTIDGLVGLLVVLWDY